MCTWRYSTVKNPLGNVSRCLGKSDMYGSACDLDLVMVNFLTI